MAILLNGKEIGKYKVVRLIKENHYCETYRVEDDKEEPFFLKLFIQKNMPERMIDPNGQVKSIKYLSKLRHKNIISYVEDGRLEDEGVGPCQYVVTNYFSGELLADKLQREGKLPEDEALRVLKDVLEGLRYMHERDLFHNDITPRNIMLSEKTGGTAELIDMSHVSKFVSGAPDFDTSDLDERYQSGMTFVGLYNNSTDLFSAMSVFYTMLTGKVPWDIEFPEGISRKERIAIAKEKRKELLELNDKAISEQFLVVMRNSFVRNGICSYTRVEALFNDLEHPENAKPKGGAQKTNLQQPQGGEDARTEEQQATQANVMIQRGKGNGFKDIAGMNDLKQMLLQKVIFVLKDRERAAKYKLTPPNGMLLYGPPGCGKSFFAEKFAEETGYNFILVKASDLGSIYVHGSQGKIADLFKKAEANAPTIICFDEFDAFVPDRSGRGAEHQAGEVNEFLTQLNNCAQKGIFVIATSNRPDMIDPAVLRTGRIDRQVYVPLPDDEARREMFKLHLNGRPCSEIDAERLAELTKGYIASDIAYIVNDAAMGAAFSDQPISQSMLESVISSTHPSISKDVADSYEEMHRKMEGTSRLNSRPRIGFT